MLARVGAIVMGLMAAVGVGFAATWTPTDPAPGEARLHVDPGGVALLTPVGGPAIRVTNDRTVHRAERLVLERGRASLTMADGVVIELRGDSDVTMGRTVRLGAGEVLVTTQSAPLRVAVSDAAALVGPQTAARISRTLAFSAAVYRGDVGLRTAGRSLAVPALRRASVAALGLLPANPDPITIDRDDTWDRRYLAVAIQLGDDLASISDGFSRNARVTEPLRASLERVMPELSVGGDLDVMLGQNRRPGEMLVGAAIATAGRSALGPVFSFRDRGASWGLVVLDRDVDDAGALLAMLRRAMDHSPLVFNTTGSVVPDELARDGSGLPAGTPAPAGDDGAAGTPSPGGASGPDDSRLPVDVPPTGTVVDHVGDTAGAVVDEVEVVVDPALAGAGGLTDGVLGDTAAAGPAIEPVVDLAETPDRLGG